MVALQNRNKEGRNYLIRLQFFLSCPLLFKILGSNFGKHFLVYQIPQLHLNFQHCWVFPNCFFPDVHQTVRSLPDKVLGFFCTEILSKNFSPIYFSSLPFTINDTNNFFQEISIKFA